MVIQELQFRGNNIRYRDIATLARRLNITQAQARSLTAGNNSKIAIDTAGRVVKLNLAEDIRVPLAFQNFSAIRKIENKRVLKPNGKITNITFKNQITGDDVVRVNIKFVIEVQFSNAVIARPRQHTWRGAVNGINDFITNSATDYVETLGTNFEGFRIRNVEIISFNNIPLEYDNVAHILRDETPLIIHNKEVENVEGELSCMENILTKKYRISAKALTKYVEDGGISIENIKLIATTYKLTLRIYDINGVVVGSHTPNPQPKRQRQLTILSHNNHAYFLPNHKFLSTPCYSKTEQVNNVDVALIEQLANNVMPTGITASRNPDEKVSSFIVNDTIYFKNGYYDFCFHALDKFGLSNQCHPHIKPNAILDIMINLYKNKDEKLTSYLFPSTYTPVGGYHYYSKTNEQKYANRHITIDRKKAYSSSLYDLTYLITTDARTATIRKNLPANHEIVPHYLYTARCDKINILLPEYSRMYWGELLIIARAEGVEFELLEELSTTKVNGNPYSTLIDNLYANVDEGDFKEIMNQSIGNMCRQTGVKEVIKNVAVFDSNNIKHQKGFQTQLNQHFHLNYDTEEVVGSIYNKAPIHCMILDQHRITMYKQMKALNITHENLIQIDTDAITFAPTKKFNPDLNGMFGWRLIDMRVINREDWIDPDIYNIEENPFLEYTVYDYNATFFNYNKDIRDEGFNTRNTLYNCYAGAGKTHYIINEIIPTLGNDYIVLTPSYGAMVEYKARGLNCSSIQHYTANSKTPKEKTVIIDEIGMIDTAGWNLVYKCDIACKVIIGAGDFKQLPPPKESKSLGTPQNLDYIFGTIVSMESNYRNNFTTAYYNTLINADDTAEGIQYILNQVDKYSTSDFRDASVVICYRNETVDKYNALLLAHHGLTSTSVGLKTICKTSTLRDNEIFNNFHYTIESIRGDEDKPTHVIFTTGEIATITQFKKYFKPAYAQTIYSLQGQSVPSYHWASEDDKFIIYDDMRNNLAYTIISRLMQNK